MSTSVTFAYPAAKSHFVQTIVESSSHDYVPVEDDESIDVMWLLYWNNLGLSPDALVEKFLAHMYETRWVNCIE
jgi:hypothetical protein